MSFSLKTPINSKKTVKAIQAAPERVQNLRVTLRIFLGGITFDGGTNGIAFRVLIEKLFVPQLWSGACVVMDNLPAHQVKGVKEMIESAGASLIYLSPYSPDFNPIEHYWSKLKQYLRSVAARSRKALEKKLYL
ncbi:MAG: hypothetical protein BRC51_08710 [Cyanobacteria bacterium SW_12_48_29]|nr:MAG: hypothetical protein BRC51_08710 [Cyanobacteria bacterium SW_12_48_29]